MTIREVPDPSIENNNEVKIKISVVGICGSDVHYYSEGRIGSQVVQYPFPLGHECSGIIVDKGKDVTGLNIGDLVVIDPSLHCGICDQCLAGRPHTCRNNRFLGCPGQLDGCLSDFIVLPDFTCLPVSGQMDAVNAALIEPLSIGVYAVNLTKIEKQEVSSAIFGAGPIGLSILMKLLADGISNVGMIEPLTYRLNKAYEVGARYLINPANEDVEEAIKQKEELLLDVIFEASGQQDAIDNALKIIKPGGKLVLVGIPAEAQYIFNMDLMRRKEVTVINVRRQNHCVEEAIELVTSGKIKADRMVTHHFTCDDTPYAFELVEGYKNGVIKAMVHF